MNSFIKAVLLGVGVLSLLEPYPLFAKKDKDKEKEKEQPPKELVYEYYGHPDKLKEEVLEKFKEEFPALFAKEFDQAFSQAINQAVNRPYGSWNLRGLPNVDVAKDGALPFDDSNGMQHLITCTNGIFEFKTNGVFCVTFGVVDSKLKCKFDIQRKLNGGTTFDSVPGGTLVYKYENGSSNALTVLIQAQVGDQLKIANTSGLVFKLGTLPADQVFAFISIHQIN